MSKVLQRATALVAVMIASLVLSRPRGADANVALEEGRTIPGGG